MWTASATHSCRWLDLQQQCTDLGDDGVSTVALDEISDCPSRGSIDGIATCERTSTEEIVIRWAVEGRQDLLGH